MVNQTIFAVSADETRPFLTGVYVALDGAEAKFVATDGGRLALRKAQLPQAARQKVGVIVPAKAMQELGRALAGVEGRVQLGMAENQLVFIVPGLRVYSRLISGQFPNYQQVIPQEFKQRIRVQTERLLRAVRRASITARDSANVVRLSAKGKKLTLTSNTPEVGKAREEVEVTAEGEPIEAAFNARYLMDCLNNIEADRTAQPRGHPPRPSQRLRLRPRAREGVRIKENGVYLVYLVFLVYPVLPQTGTWGRQLPPAGRPRRPSRLGRLGRRLAVKRVAIDTESIELAAFLKWAQAAETGGQAKMLIQTGRVKVNGRVERRRGRTLVPGDRVELGAHALEIVRA